MRQESALVELADTLAAHDPSRAPERTDFYLREKPFPELVNVRGEPDSQTLIAALRQVFGIELPTVRNTATTGSAHIALWLGPDEWLLQSLGPRAPTAERSLRPLLIGCFAAVVDVSSGFTVLELGGRRARQVLQKGCPLDLHPRVFSVGQCAQSHFFKAGVVIRPIAAEAYELIVRRSFADYAARMLLDATDM